ncbi:hypothetical protein [uncultured Photobacterium sp.]|uniref:hypothetical protein n=1 Tax=uncultured Photobacterium sp. TaxID=173973 RepID=UPI002624BF11|nr:hypothetical protein [uncultured Photobacterium sp.]
MTELISKRTKPLIMIFLATLLLFTLSDSEKTQSQVEKLLLPLIGCWQGEAVKTPRGPMAYPVCFKRLKDDTLYGIADLNISNHHWYFFLDGENSRLRFLSTVADNLTPVNLPAIKAGTDQLEFAATNTHPLHVAVQRIKKGYLFTMNLRGKEHVVIQLTRKQPEGKKTSDIKEGGGN